MTKTWKKQNVGKTGLPEPMPPNFMTIMSACNTANWETVSGIALAETRLCQ